MSNPEAEAKKELGNKAFAAKDFDEAIKYYTSAIQIDPKNFVYFSNRSASHGGKKDWGPAAEDAKECIKINPSFIKGYYRLATAQSELGDFDAALATVKQGLATEPDNPQLLKQQRQIKAKRASFKRAANSSNSIAGSNDRVASSASGAGPYRANLDSSISKEVYDLQEQLIATTKEYRTVKASILQSQKEKRWNELSKTELSKLPQDKDTKMYKTVGKMFLLSNHSEIVTEIDEKIKAETKAEADFTAKLDYLERRMKSQRQNIQELTKSASSE